MYLLASSVRRLFNVRLLTGVNRLVRIKEYSDKLDSRNKRAQQAKPLALYLGDEKIHPVMLPPGWLRLVTKPSRTGSEPVVKTIGMVVVAALAARPTSMSAFDPNG